MKEIKSYTIITLTLIFLGGTVSFFTIYRVNHLNEINQTTGEVINLTNNIHAGVLENEITILSFVTTYDSVFLESMSIIQEKLERDLETLAFLVMENESQVSRVDSIDALLVGRRHVFTTALINYPSAEELLEYGRMNRTANYLAFGEQIKVQIDAILFQQREKLRESELGLFTNLSALSIVIFTITIIGVLAAGLNFYSIYQYNLAQKASDHEIKDYQHKLKLQIEQLNSTNKELEQFAYVASHDLQEPLRKITSFNDLLQTQYKNELEGDGRLYLERIAYAARRMRKLISDLLEYSRAGRYAEEKDLINLNEIVAEILDDLSVQIEQNNAKIHVGNLPELYAHHSDFRMVFQNLISNALKFRKPDEIPKIEISCSEAEKELIANYFPNSLKGERYYHIEVKDNGIGFNTDYANKIFTIFQRLHGKDEYEGTGIGLAICKKIVDRYKGVIFATSAIYTGSSFHILIPFRQIPNDQN